jgi:hypothetical protein
MGAMIYAIFLCNSVIGNCQMMPPYVFQSKPDCMLTMLKTFGPEDANGHWKFPPLSKILPGVNDPPKTVFVNGRLYLNTMSPAQWYECEGKPTWGSVQ